MLVAKSKVIQATLSPEWNEQLAPFKVKENWNQKLTVALYDCDGNKSFNRSLNVRVTMSIDCLRWANFPFHER